MLNLEFLHDTNKGERPKAYAMRPQVAIFLHFLQQGTTMVFTTMENSYGRAIYIETQLL